MPLIDPNGPYVIYILSPEHCEEVQLKLFELGFRWYGQATIQCRERAQRLFLNYHELSGERRRISYASHDDIGWVHRDGLIELKLEDLYDMAEAPSQVPENKVNTKPTSYAKWHNQCLAKHILAKYRPIGTMRTALDLMLKGSVYHTNESLWAYAVKYVGDRPKGFPDDLLQELLRRKDA